MLDLGTLSYFEIEYAMHSELFFRFSIVGKHFLNKILSKVFATKILSFETACYSACPGGEHFVRGIRGGEFLQ
jgi:hypothetical protein